MAKGCGRRRIGVGRRDGRILLATFHLLSLLFCKVLSEEPRFVEPIPNVTVALGRDASLPCVIEHLGTYKVAWIHIDRQMILTIHRHVVARLPRFSVSHDNQRTWLLHVSGVQQEDRGYYMCQVNTNPMISQVGYLQVVVPPNILDEASTGSSVAARENQNMTLMCKADGFPAPKISWRREDGQGINIDRRKKVTAFDGEQLTLSRISRSEMGAYLCIATNGVPPSVSKRIIVDVEFPPMIWVPNQLVGAPAGTDVTIECHTEAHPRAISYWVYDSVMLLSSKKYATDTTENSYRAHMKITIRGLKDRDFGNYKCIAKNSLGETEGSIRLYEIPMPSLPPKATEVRASKEERLVAHNSTHTRSPSSSSSAESQRPPHNNNNSNNKSSEKRGGHKEAWGEVTPADDRLSHATPGPYGATTSGVCDHRTLFLDVFIGLPGRMHDAHVFRLSPMYDHLTSDVYPLLPPDLHLIGDSSYPLLLNVMTPFRDTGHLSPRQTHFNTKLSSIRVAIERAFGFLKNKFRRLKYLDIQDIDLGCDMIAASCVLHNFLIQRDEIDVNNEIMDGDNIGDHNVRNDNEGNLPEAVAKRNNIMAMLG